MNAMLILAVNFMYVFLAGWTFLMRLVSALAPTVEETPLATMRAGWYRIP